MNSNSFIFQAILLAVSLLDHLIYQKTKYIATTSVFRSHRVSITISRIYGYFVNSNTNFATWTSFFLQRNTFLLNLKHTEAKKKKQSKNNLVFH